MEGINVNSNNNDYNSVGLLTPPDKIRRCVLYSDTEASQNINSARSDIYQNSKKPSFEKRFSTPKSVLYLVGTGALAAVSTLAYKYAKKFLKK